MLFISIWSLFKSILFSCKTIPAVWFLFCESGAVGYSIPTYFLAETILFGVFAYCKSPIDNYASLLRLLRRVPYLEVVFTEIPASIFWSITTVGLVS